jgi:hypothetical protein
MVQQAQFLAIEPKVLNDVTSPNALVLTRSGGKSLSLGSERTTR